MILMIGVYFLHVTKSIPNPTNAPPAPPREPSTSPATHQPHSNLNRSPSTAHNGNTLTCINLPNMPSHNQGPTWCNAHPKATTEALAPPPTHPRRPPPVKLWHADLWLFCFQYPMIQEDSGTGRPVKGYLGHVKCETAPLLFQSRPGMQTVIRVGERSQALKPVSFVSK